MARSARLPVLDPTALGAATPRTICLVKPPTLTAPRSLSYFGSVPSLGLAYVAAALREAGHRVSVIDAPGEAWSQTWTFPTAVGPLVAHGLRLEQLVERLPDDVDVVGVTHMFLHEWGLLRALLAAIRRRHPEVLLVAGGENASAYWEHMLRQCPALDACVRGEGEASMLELVAAWSEGRPLESVAGVAVRVDGRPTQTPDRPRLRTLDAWPRPAWDLFPLEPYLRHRGHGGVARGRSLPLLTSRGCPYRCTFCSSPSMWTTRYERRDPARVVDELEDLVARHGIDNFDLHDLTALLTKRWILAFCDELQRRGLRVTWQLPSGTRAEAIDDEVAARLYDAGCRNFCYAPESGSEATLERIGKRVRLPVLLRSLRGAVEAGLRTEANIIIGFPHERAADLLASVGLCLRLATVGLHSLSVMVFAPYPGSEEYRRLCEAGRITHDDLYLYGSLLRSAGSARSHHPHLSARQLLLLQLAMLLSFFAVQYALEPRRALELGVNLVRGREQTVVDQFLATKRRQLSRSLGEGLRRRVRAALALLPGGRGVPSRPECP
ncbi:B12-binding domain-containing radical SAM protein [Paraliomyxa miuraensis]|uniref:B12-binding domain-containing radical SAM protein n=1 Tax=Paraliomyxa miuraensis TaxID=376150 RepID=UPI0022501291|nr:radical SAM protein [Paraliomyxa miuraensis]MCX4245087.1 B12-binding domain-containing radical SAM protein [Paraliomyxa miuraensis]